MLLSILKDSDMTINEISTVLKITPEYTCRLLSGNPSTGDRVSLRIERMYHGIRLKTAAKKRFGSQVAAAYALEISAPFLSQICQGVRNPSPPLAYKIEMTFEGEIKAYQLLIDPNK